MKQFRITILLTVLMSMFGVKTFAHDIAVANKDGVTIYYKWINDKTELRVVCRGSYHDSYSNEYSGDVVIPESVEYEGKTYNVTSIGYAAFRDCDGLTSVTIPNSVTSIDISAFSGCSSLTSMIIPSSVTSIGSSVFYGCSSLTSVVIPNSVTSIGESAFRECSGLTSVTIPNSVTSIGNYAFQDCSGLTFVTIPNSVTSIGEYAFYGCSGLTSATIGNSVTTIGRYAFSCCSGLTSVIVQCIPTSNGYLIFSESPNIKEVTFDCETATNLFAGYTSIEKVTIKESVTSIGEYAFYGCSGLTSVTIPNSVTSIGSSTFYGCSSLTSVTIPNSVTSIGQEAFRACTGLTSVTIPNSVTSIGSSAFASCSGLTSCTIGSGVTSIGDYAFSYTNLKKTIWLTNTPPSGASNAQGAINYVANEEYNISNKVVYPFLSSYFDVDGVRYVPVSLSDKTCDAIDCTFDESVANVKIGPTVEYKGVTMKVNKVQPYIGYNNTHIKNLELHIDGNIGKYAFYGCSSFEKIVIEPTLSSIDDNAFSNCSSLKEVIIEDDDTEMKLGAKLFDSCPLDTVYIGRNINYSTDEYSGYSPFYRNTSLRAVKITDKETEISENEFYGCTNLQRVIIGDGVTTIGNWAFSGCQSLKFFTFGSEVKTIGQEAFSDCTAVTEITSRAIAPPTCGNQALDDINKWECKLYVPKGHLADYQAAEQWKEFLFAEEGDYTIATKYTLTYMVDGEVYKTSQVAGGDAITPEPAPTKEGYIFSGWSTIPATMPANDVTITGTFSLPATEDVIKITNAGQTTWCSAYDLDFTGIEGIKAYTAGGYDRVSGTIWLMRVNQVPANEGILIIGTPGDYKVPHKTTGTYYANLMVGTLQPITLMETDGEYTNYYLSNGDSGVGFYKVNGSVDLKANRAYLPLLRGTTQAGTRFIGLGFEDDGTTNLTPALSKGEGEGAWYTLQGQRVAKPGKGIYIRNGKKVVIK